jgi:hypothetical protein
MADLEHLQGFDRHFAGVQRELRVFKVNFESKATWSPDQLTQIWALNTAVVLLANAMAELVNGNRGSSR